MTWSQPPRASGYSPVAPRHVEFDYAYKRTPLCCPVKMGLMLCLCRRTGNHMSEINLPRRWTFGILIIAMAAMVMTACAAESEVEAFPVHMNPDTGIEFVPWTGSQIERAL